MRILPSLLAASILIVAASATNSNAGPRLRNFQCGAPIAGLVGQEIVRRSKGTKGLDDASKTAIISVLDCLVKPRDAATPPVPRK